MKLPNPHFHRYNVTTVVNEDIRHYECLKCPKKFWKDGSMKKPKPLTPELKKAHDALAVEYEKNWAKG